MSQTNSSAGGRRRAPVRVDEATMDDIKAMASQLTSADFQERYKGLEQLRDMSARCTAVVGKNITSVFIAL